MARVGDRAEEDLPFLGVERADVGAADGAELMARVEDLAQLVAREPTPEARRLLGDDAFYGAQLWRGDEARRLRRRLQRRRGRRDDLGARGGAGLGLAPGAGRGLDGAGRGLDGAGRGRPVLLLGLGRDLCLGGHLNGPLY